MKSPKTTLFRPALLGAIFAGHALLMTGMADDGPTTSPTFSKDVEPFLRQYCAGCHNADDYEGELSMDTFTLLLKGGESGPAIVPGKSQESLLFRVMTGQSKPKMPPKKEPQPSTKEIQRIGAWIDAGAPGPIPGTGPTLADRFPSIPPRHDHHQAITASALSPKGDLLAIAMYRTVDLLDPRTLESQRTLAPLPGKVLAVSFSPDGSQLVAASGIGGVTGVAIIWNVADATIAQTLEVHGDILFDAVWSPDGQRLATAGYDRKIIVWNVAHGTQERVIDGHNGAVFDLAFSPGGSVLASASADQTVKLWRVETGERLDTLNQPLREQFTVIFSPDGESIFAGGADNRVRSWQFVSRDAPRINPIQQARFAHEGAVVALAIDPGNRWLLSAAEDRTLSMWSLPDLTLAQRFDAQSDIVSSIIIDAPNERVFVVRFDGSLSTLPFSPNSATSSQGDVVSTPAAPVTDPIAEAPKSIVESEPNDPAQSAQTIDVPALVSGTIGRMGDVDAFRFQSKAGQEWVLEVDSARSGSPLDSRIEVLDGEGRRIEQVRLQAVRDSWFTFRGKDSSTSDDFRLHNWQEMELNEYLYANGEVVKLWLYPRGPDSGFKVYPGFGERFTYFGTTGITHALGEPCYIVRPMPAGSEPAPNGLPVFTAYYENDDDSRRRWGKDSSLIFRAPSEGQYLATLRDTRNFGGLDFAYQLTIRPRTPDFEVSIGGQNPKVPAGGGTEFSLTANRIDGFDGEIRVEIANLPPGWHASSPIVIEAGQEQAFGVINVETGAPAPTADQVAAHEVVATATVAGQTIKKTLSNLGTLEIQPKPKLLAEIIPVDDSATAGWSPTNPYRFQLRPGETIKARVRIERRDFEGRVAFGTADAGRNMAHGVYVDNIGLNGLMIVEGLTERQFFITASPVAEPSTRYVHLRTGDGGGAATWPIILEVTPTKTQVAQR